MLFIWKYLDVDASDRPVSQIGKLLKKALYVRDLEVDVLVRAIGEILNNG